MGLEFQGVIQPAVAPSSVRVALLDHFASLGWRVVRQDGRCVAIAVAKRVSESWPDDLVLCFEPDLYLLSHLSVNKDMIQIEISNALRKVDAEARWVEL